MRVQRIFLIFILGTYLISGAEPRTGAEELETRTDAQILDSYKVFYTKRAPDVIQLIQALSSQAESCDTKKKAADFVCLEDTNLGIKSFTDEYGMLLQLASTVTKSGTIVDKCSSISSALDKAAKVLTLYQATCGTAMGICNSSCSKVPITSKKLIEAAGTALKNAYAESQVADQACASSVGSSPACAKAAELKEEVANLQAAYPKIATSSQNIAGITKKEDQICAGYEKTRNSALAGVTSALIGLKTSEDCVTNNSSKDPIADMDCKNDKNPMYASKNCQCARNELPAAQCQGIAVGGQSINNGGGVKVGVKGPTDTTTKGAPDIDGSGGGDGSDRTGGGSAQGLAGAPIDGGGGGGGLGGGGGGGGGFSQDGSGSGGRRLNANVLGGFGGGGGSGGSGSGPGYGDVDSKLKEYGPGGAKDPSRSLASEIAKQVTAEGGRSNWEKVRSRYKDNQRTLLSK